MEKSMKKCIGVLSLFLVGMMHAMEMPEREKEEEKRQQEEEAVLFIAQAKERAQRNRVPSLQVLAARRVAQACNPENGYAMVLSMLQHPIATHAVAPLIVQELTDNAADTLGVLLDLEDPAVLLKSPFVDGENIYCNGTQGITDRADYFPSLNPLVAMSYIQGDFSPDKSLFVTTPDSYDKTLILWDVKTGALIKRLTLQGAPQEINLQCVGISADNKTLFATTVTEVYTVNGSGFISHAYMVDIESGRFTPCGIDAQVSRDGRYVAVCADNGEMLDAAPGGMAFVMLNDLPRLDGMCKDYYVAMVRSATHGWNALRICGINKNFSHLILCNKGSAFAISDDECTIAIVEKSSLSLWNAYTGTLRKRIAHNFKSGAIFRVEWCPNNYQLLVYNRQNDYIYRVDAKEGTFKKIRSTKNVATGIFSLWDWALPHDTRYLIGNVTHLYKTPFYLNSELSLQEIMALLLLEHNRKHAMKPCALALSVLQKHINAEGKQKSSLIQNIMEQKRYEYTVPEYKVEKHDGYCSIQ